MNNESPRFTTIYCFYISLVYLVVVTIPHALSISRKYILAQHPTESQPKKLIIGYPPSSCFCFFCFFCFFYFFPYHLSVFDLTIA